MDWIALLPSREDGARLGLVGLQFTPRVAQVDEACCWRSRAASALFGGRKRLLRLIFQSNQALAPRRQWASGRYIFDSAGACCA